MTTHINDPVVDEVDFDYRRAGELDGRVEFWTHDVEGTGRRFPSIEDAMWHRRHAAFNSGSEVLYGFGRVRLPSKAVRTAESLAEDILEELDDEHICAGAKAVESMGPTEELLAAFEAVRKAIYETCHPLWERPVIKLAITSESWGEE